MAVRAEALHWSSLCPQLMLIAVGAGVACAAWVTASRKPASVFGAKYTNCAAPGAIAPATSMSSNTSPSAPCGSCPGWFGRAVDADSGDRRRGQPQAAEVGVEIVLAEAATELDDGDRLPRAVGVGQVIGRGELQRRVPGMLCGRRHDVPGARLRPVVEARARRGARRRGRAGRASSPSGWCAAPPSARRTERRSVPNSSLTACAVPRTRTRRVAGSAATMSTPAACSAVRTAARSSGSRAVALRELVARERVAGERRGVRFGAAAQHERRLDLRRGVERPDDLGVGPQAAQVAGERHAVARS